LGCGASFYVSGNIRLDYDYNFGRNNYPATILEPFLSQSRLDNYESHSAGLYFRIKENIGLGVIATLWERKSNIYWVNAKQTLIGIDLIYNF
jgi:hypothetical protein